MNASVKEQFTVGTHYVVEAFSPLRVSDPGMARALIHRLPGIVRPALLGLGLVTQKDAWSILRYLEDRARYAFEKLLSGGGRIWTIEYDNIVVTAGLNDIITQYFKGSGYTAAFYVGLMDGTPTVDATDTMSSHAGWTEIEDYSEGTRQTLTLGSVAAGSANNAASKAVYSIDTNQTTIGGSFITTDSTKGGSSGTLYGAAAFTPGNKTIDDGDTLSVTATVSAAAS